MPYLYISFCFVFTGHCQQNSPMIRDLLKMTYKDANQSSKPCTMLQYPSKTQLKKERALYQRNSVMRLVWGGYG